MLVFAAIANMKNMPATALFGSPLIFFFFCSAILFLIPTALISADLSSRSSSEGGIYEWVRRAFGHKLAMTAVWLQWSNTMVWYPTMLSFIAGALAYLIDPTLVEHKGYLLTTILTVFWIVTWINSKGIHTSAKLTTLCTWAGTIFPMALLILLGCIWVICKNPIHLDVTPKNLIPSFSDFEQWSALIAIMASFLGIELSGVHVSDVDQPKKTFPRAILLASIAIFFALSLSSLSIAIVLPANEINLIAGVMQVFQHFLHSFHLDAATPLLALAISLGSIGTMVNWLIAPAKGLSHAATTGFLPPYLAKKNRHGVASRILWIQAFLVSAISLFFLFQPSANELFWFLTALSTELYMLMYILMFLTSIKLRKEPIQEGSFRLSSSSLWLFAILGLIGSFLTVIVSFVPPTTLKVGISYLMKIAAGNLISFSPLLATFWYRRRKKALAQSL